MLTIMLMEVICVFAFFAGIASPENREFLWAIPAVTFIIMIFVKWSLQGRIKNIKSVNLNQKDMPPEVQEHMDKLIEILQESGKIPKLEKCNDPHCKDCWGLGNNEHKNI